MATRKKTITLGYGGNPTHTICLGKVTVAEFNDAFRNEGWKDFGRIRKDELKHEFWKKNGKRWYKATADDNKATHVTVMYW